MAVTDQLITHLKRLRCLLATGMGFVIFGFFGLLLKIILLPYTLILTNNNLSRQIKVRYLVAFIWKCFLHYLYMTFIMNVRYLGFERLGRAGQLVLVNHSSLLDVVFMLAKFPVLNCIVNKYLLHNPIMSSPILACDFLPNDGSLQLVEAVDGILIDGQSLHIFYKGNTDRMG